MEITEALFEGKERQEMSKKLKKIPLSNDTSTRRTEVLAHDLVKQLTDDIKDAPCLSLAVDESTDGTDQAHLCVFVRYLSKAKGTVMKLICTGRRRREPSNIQTHLLIK